MYKRSETSSLRPIAEISWTRGLRIGPRPVPHVGPSYMKFTSRNHSATCNLSGDRFLMLWGSNSFVACWYVVTFGSCAHRPTTETQIHNQIHRRYRNRNPQFLRANQVFLESCQHGFCSDQPHVEKKRNDSPIWMFQLRVSHRCCWWCWSIRWHSQNPDAIAFSQNPHPNCIRNLGFTLQTWCLEVEIECQCLNPFDQEHPCPYPQVQSLILDLQLQERVSKLSTSSDDTLSLKLRDLLCSPKKSACPCGCR